MMKNKKIKIKHKVVFILICILWLGSFIFAGIILRNGPLAACAMSLFSLLAAWQTNLKNDALSKEVILFWVIDLIAGLLAPSIARAISGDILDALNEAALTVLILFCIVGLPILFIHIYCRRHGIHWGDSILQEQKYSAEERERKQRMSIKLAKRVVVLSYLFIMFVHQLAISSVCLMISLLGTDLIRHLCNLSQPENFMLAKGLFFSLLGIFLVLFGISGIWSAVAYKRLEVVSAHLGSELDGAGKLDAFAANAHSKNQGMKVVGASSVSGVGVVVGGITEVANNYLINHSEKAIGGKLFKRMNMLLLIMQVVILVFEFVMVFLEV